MQYIAAKESNGPTISHKSSKEELISLFSDVAPNYDEERVYASDIKKVVQWYNLLQKNGITEFTAEEDSSEEEQLLILFNNSIQLTTAFPLDLIYEFKGSTTTGL